MLQRLFSRPKPVIAMVHVHVARKPAPEAIRGAVEDAVRLQRGGVDGLLFENWGEHDYLDRRIRRESAETVAETIRQVRERVDLPFGLNLLPLDYEMDFELAQRFGARFIQIDTFVDRVVSDYPNRFILEVDPRKVLRLRRRLGLHDVALWVNIQTKHYITLPKNKRLETSAQQALAAGADALVVTGELTGKKTPLGKIKRAKEAVRGVGAGVPLLIGSGFSIENAAELLPHADGVIVGTSLKVDGITDNPVDEERVQALMREVERIRVMFDAPTQG